MKLRKLINQLRKLEDAQTEDLHVVVDHDDNGYFDLEHVDTSVDEDGDVYINLVSSNES